MAKKDNPLTDVTEPTVIEDIVPPVTDVELAPLSARLEAVERALKVQPAKPKIEDVPLHLCNKRHQEVMKDIRAENKSVVAQVTKALQVALGGRATNERRTQKDLAPFAAEAKHTK